MSDKKETTSDVLVADAILRLQSMQNILVRKGYFTNEEFSVEIKEVSNNILKAILQKAQVPGDLDKLLETLGTITKKNTDN
jgi:hypothetical protein